MKDINHLARADYLLLIQSKYFLAACISSAICSALCLLYGEIWLAILTGVLCTILSMTRIKLITLEQNNPADLDNLEKNWLKWSSIGMAVLLLIGLGSQQDLIKVWLFCAPLLIFFFFEFKAALSIVVVFSILAAVSINASGSVFNNIQLSSTYILYLGIGCALVYLREVRRKQLKPLRRTDNLTQAATREHLEDDLEKEIQRSEREGSELAIVAMGIDSDCLEKINAKQKSEVIIELGRLLHNNLRAFDSYYLWNSDDFLIVLPHTSSTQANKIANELRIEVRKNIHVKDEKITVSAGITGLNVGDDAKALPAKAVAALYQSKQNGSNRTLLYRDEHHPDAPHQEAPPQRQDQDTGMESES